MPVVAQTNKKEDKTSLRRAIHKREYALRLAIYLSKTMPVE
jgi:hypothetical protein